jgi:hypothetical protein
VAVTSVGGNAVATTSSVTSIAPTLPAGVLAGDVGLIAHGYNPATGTTTTPSGWTASTFVVTGSFTVALYRRDLSAGESGSVTLANSGAQRMGAVLEVYRGGTYSSTATFAETASGTSHANPSGTAPAGGAVAVSFFVERSSAPSTGVTQPASYTARRSGWGTGSGSVSAASADNLTPVSSGGTVGGGSWTASAANVGVGTMTVLLVPTAAASRFVRISGTWVPATLTVTLP